MKEPPFLIFSLCLQIFRGSHCLTGTQAALARCNAAAYCPEESFFR